MRIGSDCAIAGRQTPVATTATLAADPTSAWRRLSDMRFPPYDFCFFVLWFCSALRALPLGAADLKMCPSAWPAPPQTIVPEQQAWRVGSKARGATLCRRWAAAHPLAARRWIAADRVADQQAAALVSARLTRGQARAQRRQDGGNACTGIRSTSSSLVR